MYEQDQKKPPEQNYGLSTRVMNCLKRNDIPINAQVIADSIDLLLCMRGMGANSLTEIGGVLKGFNIIHDIEEWIEGGREKLYNQRKTSFMVYSYDQHVP
jgi:DNA-directed RNA polymerase alpha subunit